VKWRENGRRRSRSFDSKEAAQAFKAEIEPSAIDKMIADAKRNGEYIDPLSEFDRFGKPIRGWSRRPRVVLAAYIKKMIHADRELRDTTRASYLRNLRWHIEDTDLRSRGPSPREP
jgi:hypothetical protein